LFNIKFASPNNVLLISFFFIQSSLIWWTYFGFGGLEGLTGVRVGTQDKEPTWKGSLSLKSGSREFGIGWYEYDEKSLKLYQYQMHLSLQASVISSQ